MTFRCGKSPCRVDSRIEVSCCRIRPRWLLSFVVQDYHKTYGNTVAVAGITFTVEPGEILGLVGPNGAGKTTTLRALAGILTPTQGRLLIAGHDVVADPIPAKAALAYIPDEPKLFDHLTVWEHLHFSAEIYRVPAWTERAEALLSQFELTEKRDALTVELSRGMRQKVAICCGYLHQPRAIMLDEPLTGLDPRGIRTIKDSIHQHAQGGAALIVSSHLLSMVEDLCTSVLILHKGRQLLREKIGDLQRQLTESGRQETLEDLFFRLTEGDKSAAGPGGPEAVQTAATESAPASGGERSS